MEQELKGNLRAVFDAFKARSPFADATIWMRAAKDARFMDRIESGRGFTVKTYDGAMRWFSTNWPDGAEWPADVPRPAPTNSEAAA